jgi:hypothetical protein
MIGNGRGWYLKTAIVIVGMCLVTPAFTGNNDPRWSYTLEGGDLQITVSADRLGPGEKIIGAVCLFQVNGGGEKPLRLDVDRQNPVPAGSSKTQHFPQGSGVKTMKGLRMDWTIRRGAVVSQGDEKKERSGSTPPDR